MRKAPAPRRFSINEQIIWRTYSDREIHLQVTIGFDMTQCPPRPTEIFCASFKTGTDNNAIVSDSCILLSRLLQYGERPHEIASRLSSPPSLLGTLAAAVARHSPDNPEADKLPRPNNPDPWLSGGFTPSPNGVSVQPHAQADLNGARKPLLPQS